MKVFTKIINMQVMLVEKILRGVSSLCYLLYFHEESSQNVPESQLFYTCPLSPLLGLQSLPWLKFSIISI